MVNKDLKIGDRVRLSPTSSYVGTVDYIKLVPSPGMDLCSVIWDNGHNNRYYIPIDDLILVESPPNINYSDITLSNTTW